MNIAILGYGKMGHEIEQIALSRGHQIGLKVEHSNAAEFNADKLKGINVAIEFSTPHTVVDNIYTCFEASVPVVVGTTAWYDRFDEVRKACEEKNQALLHASNFSIGVNIFFEINRRLAQLMNSFGDYDITMEEIHHTQKLDAPSGTALTLATDILSTLDRKEKWEGRMNTDPKRDYPDEDLVITSLREENVPGTHTIKYESAVDSIEICHTAFNRKGFATGAVLAAEWLRGKKGVFTMKDFMLL